MSKEYLTDLKSNHWCHSLWLLNMTFLYYDFDSYNLTVQVVHDVGANSTYICNSMNINPSVPDHVTFLNQVTYSGHSPPQRLRVIDPLRVCPFHLF